VLNLVVHVTTTGLQRVNLHNNRLISRPVTAITLLQTLAELSGFDSVEGRRISFTQIDLLFTEF
jgi:hypothetical protein